MYSRAEHASEIQLRSTRDEHVEEANARDVRGFGLVVLVERRIGIDRTDLCRPK